jgi:hypothetical protein
VNTPRSFGGVPPFIIPAKPHDMDLATWIALMARSQGNCELRKELGCVTPCDRFLEVDHIHARGLGGETSLANVRLICASKNRSRGMMPDPKWQQEFWFDERNSFDALRKMQMAAGPHMIQRYADLFVGDLRKRLLQHVSLICLVCGGGKTLAMVAAMLAINEEVNLRVKYGPRCGRVLWFVKERALAVQLKLELEDEIVRFNLHNRKPEISICDEPGDIAKGPRHFDIVISCPHALWYKDGKKLPRLTDEQRKQILAPFDTIIWDECDFAKVQMDRLVQCCPHALKWGLTAAPIDAEGENLLDYFVLAGVASYQSVSDHDHCLKRLLSWQDSVNAQFVKGVQHEGFSEHDRGYDRSYSGKHGKHDSLPGAMATIRTAIADCNALELRMRKAWPADWYSPHILIACGNTAEANHLQQQTEMYLNANRHMLSGDGWRSTVMTEASRPSERSEKHLFHEDKNIVHPFMRAKLAINNGRCDLQSSRILFVVDMAIRGMNNWPLLFLVDLARGKSVNVQVQFKGRDHRLPPRLSKLYFDKYFTDFCTGRYFFPDSGKDDEGRMENAFDFILNMDERLQDAGFLQWSDLVAGIEERQPSERPQGTEAPFTREDQLQIDAVLGSIKSAGQEPTIEDIEGAIEALPGPPFDPNGTRARKAREHVERVLSEPDYRRKIVSTIIDPDDVIKAIKDERPKPQEDYTDAELVDFIYGAQTLSPVADDAVSLLKNPTFRFVIAQQKHDHDVMFYRPVPKLLQLQKADGKPGLISDIGNKFAANLLSRGLIDKTAIGRTYQAINTACGIVFGIEEDGIAKNGSKLDRPGYHHVLCLPHTQRRIKDIAAALLIRWNQIKDVSELYGDVIEETAAAAE